MNKEMTGKLIAEARKEKRMTQQELADRLHITGKAVSKWETGVSHNKKTDFLRIQYRHRLCGAGILR